MLIHAQLSCIDEADEKCTLEWMRSTGVAEVYMPKMYEPKQQLVEIELHCVPTVLSRLSLIEKNFMLTRISPAGLVMYLCDALFWNLKNENGKEVITAKAGDGNLFIPMTNVAGINFFVGLSAA